VESSLRPKEPLGNP